MLVIIFVSEQVEEKVNFQKRWIHSVNRRVNGGEIKSCPPFISNFNLGGNKTVLA